jgi:hypothetical protein
MSVTVNDSAGTPERVDARRGQPHVWTIVLTLGVIAACAIGAWSFVDAPLVDTSMVAP